MNSQQLKDKLNKIIDGTYVPPPYEMPYMISNIKETKPHFKKRIIDILITDPLIQSKINTSSKDYYKFVIKTLGEITSSHIFKYGQYYIYHQGYYVGDNNEVMKEIINELFN